MERTSKDHALSMLLDIVREKGKRFTLYRKTAELTQYLKMSEDLGSRAEN